MDKKKIFLNNFIGFVFGGIVASVYFLNNPTVKIIEKEVESEENLKTINSLKQSLYFEKYNNSLLSRDLKNIQQQYFQMEKETEVVEKIQKPDGTSIVIERRTKDKSLNSNTVKSEEKSIQLTESKEKEKSSVSKEEKMEFNKEFHSYEREYSFRSSFSLGIGCSYSFDEGKIEYTVLSTYNFSQNFSLFLTINLKPKSSIYPEKIDSIGIGFSFVF